MIDLDEYKELERSILENEAQLALFDTPGMRLFQDKVHDMAKNYSLIDNINTPEQLYFRKGQLDILKWMLSWKESVQSVLSANVEYKAKIDSNA